MNKEFLTWFLRILSSILLTISSFFGKIVVDKVDRIDNSLQSLSISDIEKKKDIEANIKHDEEQDKAIEKVLDFLSAHDIKRSK